MKNKYRIQPEKLQEAGKNFNNQVDQLMRQMEGDSSFTNKDARRCINRMFDGVRDTALSIFPDSQDSNPGSFTDPAEQSPDKTSNSVISEETELKGTYFDSLAAYSESRQRRPRGPEKTLPCQESISPAYEEISPDTSNDQAGQSLLDDDTRPEEPTAGPNTLRRAIVSMLRGIGQKLMGFFQWLLNKIKETAQKVWNKVCEAFTCMFNFLGSLCHRICGSEGPSNPSPHTSVAYEPMPCLQQAMKLHAA